MNLTSVLEPTGRGSRLQRGGTGSRLEAGDLLAFLYALVLVREAFWLLPETAAWAASFGVAALLGLLRLGTRRPRPALPAAFWLGVAAPLAVFWSLHLPYPDTGFDVLTYHILHGERALRGLLVVPGDFYPHYFPFLNPAPDMLSGLLRWALGYRLGTIGSFLALVWTGALLFRILERAISSPVVRALATLWIVSSEGVLWEVGNYMVDLYGLPLLLEAASLALPGEKHERSPLEDMPLLGLLLGSAVAFKLTNLAFAVAIGIVFLGRLLVLRAPRRDFRRLPISLALAAAAFLLPIAPHALFLWWTTGSPLFPHYNAVFHSPLFPPFNTSDARFGPLTSLQAIVWPVASAFHPERLSEMETTSGRLALGYLGAFLALLLRPRERWLIGLASIVVVGSILWSLGAGNHRYGLFVEMCGGLVLVLLAARGVAAASQKGPTLRLLATLAVVALAAQSILVLKCVRPGDWGGRPSAFHEPCFAWKELRRLGSDRDLTRELPPDLRILLSTVAGWVDAAPMTTGLMALLAPRLPIIGLRVEPVFEIPANLTRFDEALRVVEGLPLASLAFVEDLETARTELARRGFRIRREHRFGLPFFSGFTRLGLVAFDLAAPPPHPLSPGEKTHIPTARELVLRRPPASSGAWQEDPSLTASVDEPAEGEVVAGRLLVRGWARIPGEDLDVAIRIDGERRAPDAFRRVPRGDVQSAIPTLGDCSRAGFEAVYLFRTGDERGHEIAAVFRDRRGRVRSYPARHFLWKP